MDITEEIPFDIPESWNWCRLNYISDIYNGNSISENIKKQKYTNLDNGYNYIATKDVGFDNNINYLNGIKIPFEEDKFKIAYANTTIMCIEGGSAGRKIAYTNQDICFGNKLATFNTFLINSKFLFYYLQSPYIFDYFKSNMTGIIGGVSINKLKQFIIALPPIEEQERIIKKVEEILPIVEEYNEKYERLEKLNNSYKEELKKSILQYAIQGKLVKQNENDEPASILIDKILNEKREMMKRKEIKKENLSIIYKDDSDNQFYEKFDDGTINNITNEIPFDIPDNWSWTRLKNIGQIIGGGTPKTDNPENWVNGDIPWLTPADMKYIKGKYVSKGLRNITKKGLEKSSATLMPKDAILYSSRAPIGYIAIAINEISTNQGFKSINLVNKSMVFFIYYLLIERTSYIISKASGTTFKEISGTEMGNIIIPVAPLIEEYRIVNKIENLLNIL